jgi:ankyrin repeat protein
LIWLLLDGRSAGSSPGQGANPNMPDANGDYPLTKLFAGSDSAPLEQHRLSALAILLKCGATDVDVTLPGSRNTPLHLAVRRQDYRAVAMLLYKSANVNAKNAAGTTPLQITANQFRGEMTANHALVLDLLLQYGANVDERAGVQCRTALHWAVCSGTAHAVQVLLERGANVASTDSTGHDAIGLAIQNAGKLTANRNRPENERLDDHVDIMERLIAASDQRDWWPMKKGKCPVQTATQDGDLELLERLLKHGLDPTSPFLDGNIRDYAIKHGSPEVQLMVGSPQGPVE